MGRNTLTEVCTRFAPSPTGFLHIGGARTALFSWLYARHHHGRFILRIEDTDSERSSEKSVQTILEGLSWLGLDYDDGPFFQLDNLSKHQAAADRLLEEGKAYHCYCSEEDLLAMREQQRARNEKPRYDRRCRERTTPCSGIKPTVRFKTPLQGSVEFHDLVHGKIVVENSELDDLILIRSDGTPTYNLCVVVDDLAAAVTHVIRGDDHLNNTPRQIHLLQALQAEVPTYAHLPMILDKNGKRLSKREGAASVLDYRTEGYLPHAILNYLLRLGWSYGDQEVFNIEEMIDLFDLNHVGKAAAALNPEKLDWLNQHYMQAADLADMTLLFTEHLKRSGYALTPESAPVIEVYQALCSRYKNLKSMAQGAAFLYSELAYNNSSTNQKLPAEIKPAFEFLSDRIAALAEWNNVEIKRIIDETLRVAKLEMKVLGPALRFALTGGAPSPELALTIALVGRQQSIARLRQVLKFID